MRRKEKEVSDREAVEAILQRAQVCRIAFSKDDIPYIAPMIFGYKDSTVYLHSAPEGKKIDMLRANPNVCFEVDVDQELVKAETACDWGMKYRSVIAFGKAHIIEDAADMKKALDIIMGHYSPGVTYDYPSSMLEHMAVIRIDLDSVSVKHSDYQA
jgi:nitroimidazol reductase NimA-like FMN-containing flavoprotein (pyridoxamine 5'-phosphate oxidase superfamily)